MVDYEMFLPHSPPVFSHSPPTSFLTDYASLRFSGDSFPKLQRTGSCRQVQHQMTNYKTSFTSPKRPCLIIRTNEEACSSGDEDPTSPSKLKKKVVFADDKGMSLTQVRVMSEPSNVPPLWSLRFLAEVTQGVTAEPEAQKQPWEIVFAQPASDYVQFRKKLDTNMVSLENVIIKETEEQIVGTVKVKNISYHKKVFVRSSSDNWKTNEDTFCTYVPNNITTGTTFVIFDTFSFKINLPPKSKKIEFCVCFACDGNEYWDSNDGQNYVILKKALAPLHRSSSDPDLNKLNENKKYFGSANSAKKFNDVSQAKLDSWSQFASWNHLENSAPYW